MKKLVLILVMSLAIGKLSAQQLTYTEVIEVPVKTAKELYDCAKIWFALSYKNSNRVIQIDKFEEGKGIIVGSSLFEYNSGIFSGSGTTKGVVNYIIKIETKEGRYKYEITQFIHEARNMSNTQNSFGIITNEAEYPGEKSIMYGKTWYNRVWNDIKIQIEDYVSPVIPNLKEGLNSSACISETDW